MDPPNLNLNIYKYVSAIVFNEEGFLTNCFKFSNPFDDILSYSNNLTWSRVSKGLGIISVNKAKILAKKKGTGK